MVKLPNDAGFKILKISWERPRPAMTFWADKQLELSPSSAYYQEVLRFIKAAHSIDKEMDRARSLMLSIIEGCTTVGQIKRVMPEMIPFLPESMQKGLADMKVRSPWPKNISVEYVAEEKATVLTTLSRCLLSPPVLSAYPDIWV